MIYIDRDVDDPIYQGDIFSCVPFAEFSILEDLASADGKQIRWADYVANATDGIPVVIQLRPVTAMIISQDCEVARDEGSATLALVDKFSVVNRAAAEAKSPKTFQKHITKLSRVNVHWFYLPRDRQLGFDDRMAVDFQTTMALDVSDLLALRNHRLAGLNDYAREHLRHRVGYFFSRYPVDEWYALDREEMGAYRDDHPDAEPYPWQDNDDDDTNR